MRSIANGIGILFIFIINTVPYRLAIMLYAQFNPYVPIAIDCRYTIATVYRLSWNINEAKILKSILQKIGQTFTF